MLLFLNGSSSFDLFFYDFMDVLWCFIELSSISQAMVRFYMFLTQNMECKDPLPQQPPRRRQEHEQEEDGQQI